MKSALAVLLLLVALVAADVAPLLHSDSPTAIPGSYIVILKEHLEVLDRDAHIIALQDKILATGASARTGNVYHMDKLLGFHAELTEDLLKYELAHPDVKYIEADQILSINYQQEERAPQALITQIGSTWGITRVGQRDLNLNNPQYIYNDDAGQGATVYVIDTGILCTHVDFGTRCTNGPNYITNEANNDLNGHGTHCAGTVAGTTYGVAKQAKLVSVKVLSASGSGTTAGVISGVQYVFTAPGAASSKVGSMSLGGGASTTLDQAVQTSISQGVSYAIAAGNDNANACKYAFNALFAIYSLFPSVTHQLALLPLLPAARLQTLTLVPLFPTSVLV
jgi:subtilisin family serine protease